MNETTDLVSYPEARSCPRQYLILIFGMSGLIYQPGLNSFCESRWCNPDLSCMYKYRVGSWYLAEFTGGEQCLHKCIASSFRLNHFSFMSMIKSLTPQVLEMAFNNNSFKMNSLKVGFEYSNPNWKKPLICAERPSVQIWSSTVRA